MSEASQRETWRVLNLSQEVDEPDSAVQERARRLVGLTPDQVRGCRIAQRSVDARRSGRARRVRFVVHVDLVLDAGCTTPELVRAERAGRAVLRSPAGSLELGEGPHSSLRGKRVAVLGAGPAGLFAALTLARNGCAVEVLDRGEALEQRGRSLARFLRTGVLDPETNLLYGEGGAGTYSDGKLYTRVDHALEVPILEELVACGAPPEIAFDARAHIGTDQLHRVLPQLRTRMQELGVRFHWNTRVEGLVLRGGAPQQVIALATTQGELTSDALILATGHSARDSLRQLVQDGVVAESKPFQFGVRVEHPQELIDRGRYGEGPERAALGPAYYSLLCKAAAGSPAVHSFCMCPGGQIVASVDRPQQLCTNGMSNSRHSSPWANAALVVTLGPSDFGRGVFAGVAFQERMERAFFDAGGGGFRAPAQRVSDFLRQRETADPGASSYKFGTQSARIDHLLPAAVAAAIARALTRFDRQIPGFAGSDGLMVGVESRSSGPLRLVRESGSRLALGFGNLYPVGEGAGYAGGIMSAAIDGARSAQQLLRQGVA